MGGDTFLDVRVLHSDDYTMLMAKGHHASAEFTAACEKWNGGPLEGWGRVRHGWHRNVPCRTGEYQYLLLPAKQGARGAYPTTTVISDPLYDTEDEHGA